MATAETTFDEAFSKIDQGRTSHAVADLTELAKRGDARAQYILGLAYLKAEWVERDMAQGLSWLQIAADGYRGSFATGVSDEARESLLKVGPYADGTDLIKADRITADFLKSYNTTLDAAEERGRARLLAAASEGSTTKDPDVVAGCALDPRTIGCPKPDAASTGERCTGPFPAVQSPRPRPPGNRSATSLGPTIRSPPMDWRWEGKVIFLSHIDRSGLVCRVTLVQNSGFPLLDRAALDAVRTWRWTPALADGQLVESIQPASAEFLVPNCSSSNWRPAASGLAWFSRPPAACVPKAAAAGRKGPASNRSPRRSLPARS